MGLHLTCMCIYVIYIYMNVVYMCRELHLLYTFIYYIELLNKHRSRRIILRTIATHLSHWLI